MPLTVDDVDWNTGVITVPTDELTLVQSNPNIIYDYLMDDFWRDLRRLEDSETGRSYPRMCDYNAPTSVGGVELAAVFVITDYYTVTFQDGQYAVNLKGMNTNVGDRINVNQVSIRSSNSAGLVNSQAIEYGEYDEAVTIDYYNITGKAVGGQSYPTGTHRRPSDNIKDTVALAVYYGFHHINVIGNLPLGFGNDISGFTLVGSNAGRTLITINSDAETFGCEIVEATVTGNLDGGTLLRRCVVRNLNYINGFVYECMLDPGTITLGGTDAAHFLNCYSGIPGQSTPTIAWIQDNTPLAMRNYNGGILLENKTGDSSVSIDLGSGQVKIAPTCINGGVVVRGDGKVFDTSGNHMNSGTYNGNLVLDNEANYGVHMHEIWQFLGLDEDNPVDGSTANELVFGGIKLTYTDNGDGTGTVIRSNV